jgi:hypothetical protein
VALTGCSLSVDVAEFIKPEAPLDTNSLAMGYKQVVIGQSTVAEVFDVITEPQYELLSQSKNVVAAYERKKWKDWKAWFKLVAFDEKDCYAVRKYWFVEDERPKQLFNEPWEGLFFDAEMLVDVEVLAEPYNSENARRIALLKWAKDTFNEDMREVSGDSKELRISGMQVNQAFETVITKLDVKPASPAKAAYLIEPLGLEFDHINYRNGRIRQRLNGDILDIKIRLGMPVKKMNKCETIEEMDRF